MQGCGEGFEGEADVVEVETIYSNHSQTGYVLFIMHSFAVAALTLAAMTCSKDSEKTKRISFR